MRLGETSRTRKNNLSTRRSYGRSVHLVCRGIMLEKRMLIKNATYCAYHGFFLHGPGSRGSKECPDCFSLISREEAIELAVQAVRVGAKEAAARARRQAFQDVAEHLQALLDTHSRHGSFPSRGDFLALEKEINQWAGQTSSNNKKERSE